MKLARLLVASIALLGAGAPLADEPAARPAARTVSDIVALLDHYQPDPARVAQLRAVLDAALPATEDRHDLADAHVARARAAQELGAVQRQIAELKAAIEFGGGGENLGRVYKELSMAEMQGGRFRDAIEARRQAIAMTPGNMGGQVISDYVSLADSYRRLGDLDSVKKALDQARAHYAEVMRGRKVGVYGKNWASTMEAGEAYLLYGQGRYGEAEARMRKALELLEEDMKVNPRRVAAGLNSPPQVQLEASREFLLTWIAEMERQQDKLYEAEVTVREALRSMLSRVGRDSPNTANGLVAFARILNTQGRAREAEALARQSLAIYDRLGTPPESFFRGQARLQLATALFSEGKWREAVTAFDTLLADTAADAAYQARLKKGNLVWATALIRAGRANDAVVMLRNLVAEDTEWFGPRHFQTAEMRGLLGFALARSGDKAGALKEFRFAVPILLAANLEEERSPGRMRRLAMVLEAYIALLSEIRGGELEKTEGIDAASEAFRLADALRGQETQAAVAAAAARGITGSGELGELIRREQDLRQEGASLRRILTDLMASPPDQQLPKVIAEMKARLDAIGGERKALRER
ncbi:MAG TPA: tetratricopeptide repeat protein, partial [Rhodocyclaceae bacterium]|nr:tetratricopeptide repeat protein [Rhodocyclaceae bacterium]